MQIDSIDKFVTDDVFLELRHFVQSRNVHLKLEGFNAGGSIKLKTATALVRDAETHRNLKSKRKFIESSSGNLGLALSVIAAARGYHFTCVVDKNSSEQSINIMRALGTTVVIIDKRDSHGGYLGSRLEYIHAALARDPDQIWLNQYQNRANPEIHAQQTARSVLDEFDHVDYLFVGAGTTGTLMGCVAAFRVHSPATRLIAVDSIGSVTFGTPGQRRHLPGLGASVMPHFFDRTQIDDVIQIPEAETVAMCRDISARYGYLSGASTGTVLAAIRRMHATIPPDARVVAISPDLGHTYLDTVYNDAWCNETFGSAWQEAFASTSKDIQYA
ncbi:2,3-diaminopropionate biosynthesis protein SbnA [Burkholderia sp. LMG 21824]|uniref:2,3-diaminopropionate biosynthesis protein SbnA n=1 Tax=Burkholderia sp. LMG 21824 TaxID=3158172 RepID=UPI003C2F8E9C